MAADSDETLMDSPSEDTEVSVVTFGESGYSSSPFLIQVSLREFHYVFLERRR